MENKSKSKKTTTKPASKKSKTSNKEEIVVAKIVDPISIEFDNNNPPKVKKIIQKTPSHRYVVLEDGRKLKIKKDQLNSDMTLRYL